MQKYFLARQQILKLRIITRFWHGSRGWEFYRFSFLRWFFWSFAACFRAWSYLGGGVCCSSLKKNKVAYRLLTISCQAMPDSSTQRKTKRSKDAQSVSKNLVQTIKNRFANLTVRPSMFSTWSACSSGSRKETTHVLIADNLLLTRENY